MDSERRRPVWRAPVDLRCEYLADPLGIDVLQPRLSWRFEWPGRGQSQTAYRLLVASGSDLLAKDQGDLWDSGKVRSGDSIQLAYAGKELKSGMSCYWKVQAWDASGRQSRWSKTAIWSMGLLKPEDWKAKWIGMDGGEEEQADLLKTKKPSWIWLERGAATSAPAEARYFRRIVFIPGGRQIARAVCQMTADDGFTLLVNGQEAARGAGHPNAVSVDLAAKLHPGANVLSVAAFNSPGPPQNPAGLLGALCVEFVEGAPLVIVTDAGWRASAHSTAGWEKAEFKDSAWSPAAVLGPNGMAPWGQIAAAGEHRRLPARMLRHDFLLEKKVAKATAYVCGLGFFEMHLNGRKVGDHVMDPGLTRYDRRALYVTFDVSEHLRQGANTVGIILGNARYFEPRIKVPAPFVQFGYPKLLFQMDVAYCDGSRATVVGDEHWRITDRGPIRANNEYDGEEYDARMEQEGWDRPGFDDASWKAVERVAPPGGRLAAQMMEPMRVTEVLKPVAITNPNPGTFLVDFGQNLYGAVRLKVAGSQGTAVRMRTAYSKKPDGTLKMEDNRSAALDRSLCPQRTRGGGLATSFSRPGDAARRDHWFSRQTQGGECRIPRNAHRHGKGGALRMFLRIAQQDLRQRSAEHEECRTAARPWSRTVTSECPGWATPRKRARARRMSSEWPPFTAISSRRRGTTSARTVFSPTRAITGSSIAAT